MKNLIDRSFDVPGTASKLLGQIDRFGSIRLAPEFVGFDSTDISWDRITAVTTEPISSALSATALEREMERLRKTLPPVPGRKWAVSKVTDVLSSLFRTALERVGPTTGGHVVSGLTYSAGLGRSKSLNGGAFVSVVLSIAPEANAILLTTAERKAGATIVRKV